MNGTAAHESGHALIELLRGLRVTKLEAHRTGGVCQSEGETDEDDPEFMEAISFCAGAVAADLLIGSSDFSAHIGETDLQGFHQATAGCKHTRKAAISAAYTMLGSHLDALEFLADELDREGEIDEDDLAALCRAKDSPLAKFADLYPEPEQQYRARTAWEGVSPYMHAGVPELPSQRFPKCPPHVDAIYLNGLRRAGRL